MRLNRRSQTLVVMLIFCAAWLASFLVLAASDTGAHVIAARDLRVEQLRVPLSIDTAVPRFSWKLAGDGYGVRQTAYSVLVEDADHGAVVWASGRVESEASLWIKYAGQPLASNTPYRWKVQVWTQDVKSAGWSDPAVFQTALLSAQDWTARWIRIPYAAYENQPGFKKYTRILAVTKNAAYAWVPDSRGLEQWIAAGIQDKMNGVPDDSAKEFQRDRLEELQPAPMFRREFTLRAGLKRAVLHYCGLGLVEMSVNGERIGDHTWDPAFTDYDKRAMYLTADVTGKLKPGPNAIGALVGDGWYGQSIGFSGITRSWRYGDPGLIAQLELVYEDGAREQIVTDGSWQCTLNGPVVKNGVWCGEFYDAGKEMPGWDTAVFAPDVRWQPAMETPPLSPRLEAQMAETIREVETSNVRELTQPKPGVWVADLGRILTGYCELSVKDQPPGTLLLLTFGQSLNADGTVSTQPGTSCGSWPIDGYVCRGGGLETWKPRFTFHAFRYVQLDGLVGQPKPDVLVGRFTSTATPPAGSFECSVPLLNDLHHALVRTTQAY